MDSINQRPDKMEEVLQKHFGYRSFWPLQKEIIQNVVEGKDAVVLMPTGGGKSICYQIPALMNGGLTLVISPLIALMKDQVERLQSNGIAASYLNSSLTYEETRQVASQLQKGNIKLLYVAPERIFTGKFTGFLKKLNINLIAIDEAHCVSSWGHHFRPVYKKLSGLKELFPDVPTMALTATADKAVRSDIGELLHLKDPEYFISSFDRPNLSLTVLPGQKKWQQILKIVNSHPGEAGIIYCSSRAATENLSERLQDVGKKAKCYHAGLESKERSRTQEEFLQGQTDIICATIAFGMGIDKPDIRFVIHYNMPGNLESYYQEIGRAGRDGKPAETILFYSYRDVQTQIGFIQQIEDDQYREIQLAKLKRMQEYAEGQVCRRKILLSCFSEIPEKDCGNCDVCHNPPRYFNGTVQAQMALSAITRMKEKAGISTLVDVLKGVRSENVRKHGFDRIKTFGRGRDVTSFAWQMYIQQMLQQGIIELDYKDHYTLKLTSESREILFNDKRVRLVSPEVTRERQERRMETPRKLTKKEQAKNELFEKLRKLRKELADEQGKPAFTVFSDHTLQELTESMPATYEEFLGVDGVGEYKAKKYAAVFLKALTHFPAAGKLMDTHRITWALINQGMETEEIAKIRNIQITTVYSHLAKLLSDGYDVHIQNFMEEEELKKIKAAVDELGFKRELRPYYEFLGEKIDYGKIRLGISYLSKKGNRLS